MGRNSYYRRREERERIRQEVINNPDADNPYERGTRQWKAFAHFSQIHHDLEDMLDILGGRPEERKRT